MTTEEFIEKLREADPEGTKLVFIDGCFYSCSADEIEIESDDEELIIK